MRTSGALSEGRLTVAVFLIAFGFLVVLMGGPSEFMLTIQQGLEAVQATIVQMYQGTRT